MSQRARMMWGAAVIGGLLLWAIAWNGAERATPIESIASAAPKPAPTATTAPSDAPPAPKLADAEAYAKTIKPFFAKHCTACHGEEKQKGKLRLDTLAVDFVTPKIATKWIEVMDNLNLGEMPPEEKPRPDIHAQMAVTHWIAAELRNAERLSHGAGGRVVLRRMNRTEYANTIRDLMGMTFLPGDSPVEFLPPDGTAEGFDKVSAALMLDPSLLNNYFEVAQIIADKAIADGPPPFKTETMRLEMEDIAKNRAIDYLCATPGIECGEKDIVLMRGSTRSYGVMKYPGTHDEIPVKGMYRIRVRAWGERSAEGDAVIMRVRQNHPQADQELLMETEVTDEPKVYEIVVPRDPKCGEYNVSIVNETGFETTSQAGVQIRTGQDMAGKAKDYERVIRLQSRQQMEALTWGMPDPKAADTSKLRKLHVDWIECTGPLYDQWPPKSHEMLLGKGEGSPDPARLNVIFERFMTRAFRRPVDATEIDPIVALCRSELEAGATFNDAVRAGVVAVLCSPRFLYIAEPSNTKEPRPLDEWEMASRLSYFLWSSMPDDALFDLARAGKLRDPATLTAQVDRMLADERADGFVRGFGAQWLRTDEFRNFTPDTKIYKQYNDKLGEAMVGQTLAFFGEVLRRNEPATCLFDSDWTMLNEPLAKFYGIDGVTGEEFRRVKLPADSHRGGLLGMAGVAMRGSDGNRTKPVNRGKYVREVLFNDPPDPPPPNAGEVEPNIKGKNLTVRDRLIQHQQIESCAACHKGIDGYGLALENFNAIGAWRERQDGENFRGKNTPPIDPSGTLPNGKSYETFEQYKALLGEQKDRFARGLSEKMLTYALGRPIEPSDRGLVDRLATQMAAHGYTLRSLIDGVVTSEAFMTK
ncbi:MAG: DUF1592 domain-containing protein [Phycisphaera sp.]|nr:DUF1592 domain-containing protein [Phycisphaera sp.]